MVLFFPSSEFFEQSGNQLRRFQEELRDGIAGASCDIWAAYPRFVTNGRNPASSFARGFMNQMCSARQPPPPLTTPNFSGGQCCDKPYIVFCSWQFIQCNGNIGQQGTANPTITGKVIGLSAAFDPPGSNQFLLTLVTQDCSGVETRTLLTSTTQCIVDNCSIVPPSGSNDNCWDLSSSTYEIVSVTTADGSADDCGNPEPSYPPDPPPESGDLTTIINITNLDGNDTEYELTWNQTNNIYNFPFTYQLNGVAVTLDVGGISIYGDVNVTSPNGGNQGEPPGSQGGNDEEGNPYVVIFPNQEYPTVPDITQPETIETDLQRLVCDSGVITPVIETIRSIGGLDPALLFLLEVLNSIIEEICMLEENTADLGFPEVYPELPGAERPALLYYYKEFINGEKQKSTYTSTISNPSSSAVADINSIVVPDKTTGTHITSLKLTDGSRITATGADEFDSLTNFQFLLNQVDSSFVPANPLDQTVLTVRQGIVSKSLKCTQIEYYPNGRASSVAPAIRRIINPQM